MVVCIIALIIFSIAGIWSAKYRQLAKESFGCVFRMMTFRPCISNIDEKIKAKITAKLMKFPTMARFFYKNFKLLSWMFVITFFVSLAYSAYAIYNLVVYGNCEPGTGICIINEGANYFSQFTQLFTCYQAQVIYEIIIVVVVVLLAFKYLKFRTRKQEN